ncbi:MAG: DUF3224 domain-containing protein [Sphingomonadaceae bacterium]|nr:DUF3224 domain-containing protein [Sphingomonadaceae bacterium]
MGYRRVLAATLLAAAGQAEAAMHQASGRFDVAMTPALADPAWLGHMTMAKTYHGPLAATAAGEFWLAGDPKSGSAGYVAAEKVEGTLDGRQGSFVLMHSATMTAGKPEMRVFVVPGSGTGALAGLTGTLAIRIEGGQHFYTLDYDLP